MPNEDLGALLRHPFALSNQLRQERSRLGLLGVALQLARKLQAFVQSTLHLFGLDALRPPHRSTELN